MNKLEAFVYGIVKKHPYIKKTIKTIYQGTFDLLPRKKETINGDYDFKEGYFFGFHDISPISEDEKRCLANKVPFDGRMPKKGESMDIGYFDFTNGKIGHFHKITETYAWNYHKGCRLQWLDNDNVIYNTAEGDKLISEIRNIVNGEITKIDYPIDAIYCDKGKKFATNFCYERLNRCMPGYGYAVNDNDINIPAPSNSGLFIVNLLTGKRHLLVSLKDLAESFGAAYSVGYYHFVTHSEFSFDGRYIAFLYRAVPIGLEGKDMHKTWILVYDLKAKKIIKLPTQESGSHYVWNKKNEIIASCILEGKCCHVLFNVTSPDNYRIIAGDIVNSDGHQTFVSDTTFITDTYPDRRRMAKLYSIDIEKSSVSLIAEIYSPKKYQTSDVFCHIACDLHPRVSPSKKYLCFDSPRTGVRSLYIMKL